MIHTFYSESLSGDCCGWWHTHGVENLRETFKRFLRTNGYNLYKKDNLEEYIVEFFFKIKNSNIITNLLVEYAAVLKKSNWNKLTFNIDGKYINLFILIYSFLF